VHLSDTKTTFDSGGVPQGAGVHKQIPRDTKNGKDSEPRTGLVREFLSAVLLSEADPDSLLWRERSKDLKKRSKLMLKMIYFFQVLPFYLLQFCSGMGVGEFIQYLLHTALLLPAPVLLRHVSRVSLFSTCCTQLSFYLLQFCSGMGVG
jgi:hypothetical protein